MVGYIPDFMAALNTPLVAGTALLAYLPQRPPMVLVDALWQADAKQAQTSFTIQSDTIFVQDGCFQAPGLLENMAQTAAIRAGWIAKGSPNTLGYMAAIKNTRIYALPTIQTIITTKIYLNYQTDSFLLYRGFVYVKEQLMAESDFTIVFAAKNT